MQHMHMPGNKLDGPRKVGFGSQYCDDDALMALLGCLHVDYECRRVL